MKKIVLLMVILFSVSVHAQVTKVSFKASGLTCSMCSNAINKALKTLGFVESVRADIRSYTFDITMKPNSEVDFDKIRDKVEGAGFSIISFTAFINFSQVHVRQDEPIIWNNMTFRFVQPGQQLLNGMVEVKILNKGFISRNEYRKNNYPVLSAGTYYAGI